MSNLITSLASIITAVAFAKNKGNSDNGQLTVALKLILKFK
jgi:hypothetical protein